MTAPAHIARRFPHARQVALIERYVTRTIRARKGKRWVKTQVKSAVAVFIITSLDAREAAPAHLAGYVADTGPPKTRSTGSAMSRSVRTRPGKDRPQAPHNGYPA